MNKSVGFGSDAPVFSTSTPTLETGTNNDSYLEGIPLVFPKHYPVSLSEALHNAAKTKNGIIFVGDRGSDTLLTYRELLDKAIMALGGLQKLGVIPGSKVILQLDELDEFLIVFWGCILGGMVPVPVLPFRNANPQDTSFKKLQEIAAQLNDPVILMSDRNADSARDATTKDSSAGTLQLQGRIVTFSDIGNSSEKGRVHVSQGNDLAFLQFTSGSTSFPKGTQISHENVLVTIHSMMTALNVSGSSCFLNWMPYYHDMGLIAGHLMGVVSKCKIVAMKPFTFVRRPLLWLTKIHEHRVNITFSPNFGLKRILEKARPDQLSLLDLSCIDVILNGAEPISAQTCNLFLDLLNTHCGLRKECLLAGYGLAEASLAVTIAPRGELFKAHILNRDALGCGAQVEHVAANSPKAARFIDVGPAVTGMALRIVDDNDQIVPVGTVGHVQIKGRSVTRGYFANEEANQRSFCADWFRTGDLGFVNEDHFTITGRVKDVVFVNGQNYYSHDFEHACEDIEGLERLVVIGHFDQEREEEIILAFVACNNQFIGAREKTTILRKVQIRINQRFDVTPTLFVLLKSTGEMPKTTSGKIIRHQLLENYLEGQFTNQCIQLIDLLEIAPDLSSESDAGKHVTIAELKLLIRHFWSEVLGISERAIGDHDPFYSLGGTSIKAIEVVARAEEAIDCPITLEMFREYDTIDGLANHIARENITIKCKLNALESISPSINHSQEEAHLTEEKIVEIIRENSSPADIRENDIAIIGMGCIFPHANNIEEFWQLLQEGRDCVTEVPNDRYNINHYYDEKGGAPNKTVSKWGSFIESHCFDPKFFNLNEDEAISMDPHQRVFLSAAWQAIQDSGLVNIEGSRMGVFVGASGSGFYQQREDAGLTPSSLTGTLANLVAARVSNAFNLKGPSLTVDTACSSSLVAIDLACKSILNGESGTALAGGVQLLETIMMYLWFSRAGILSPEGKCYSFSDKANGFVPGEGAGAVILKRYRQAIADGDRVYAVIKASATNNDGVSLGIMSPNPEGQEAVIRDALRQADINPADIGYVEAHGTGTNIGDLIEVRSLSLAYNDKQPIPKQSCAIGSVKTNFGHQLCAAGVAGLMKASLAIYHAKIPATLNCETERKEIKFAETPFFVCHKSVPWPNTKSRRLAAVNSFGFGGTNAHVILSNAYHEDVHHQLPAVPGEPQVFCISAKSPESLDASRAAFASFAKHCSHETAAKDVAYTYGARRVHYRQNRIAIVADTLVDAAIVADGGKAKHAVMIENKKMSRTRRRMAWLFSGQGSQAPGMGKTLFNTEPVFRDAINVCDEIVSPLLGVSLQHLLVSSTKDEEINSTAITQPVVFAMDYALAKLWQSWGVKADYMLGHSIGEYVAACLGGMFSLEDALKTVVKRGDLMGSLPPGGGMTAVLQAPGDLIKRIQDLELPLDLAAYNGPMSTVVSGELTALRELHARLDEQAIAYQPLKVSHAFHSRHMEPIIGEFKRFLAGIAMNNPTVRLVSNVSGAFYQGNETTPDYWADHIRSPVQFHKGVQNLVVGGTEIFLEIGHQAHLTGLARRVVSVGKALLVSSFPKGQPDATEVQHFSHTKATLYANGVDIDWRAYYGAHGERRSPNQHSPEDLIRRNSHKVGVLGGRMKTVPTYALERRSMFRAVDAQAYPFKHMFKRVDDGKYEYVYDPDSVLFRDHVVSRTPMLSAAGQCDLLSYLHTLSFAHAPKYLGELSFQQPWLAKSKLTVSFSGKLDKEFVVTDTRGNTVFKGLSSTSPRSEVPPRISVLQIEQRLPVSYTHDKVYDLFRRCGIEYGPFHRHIAGLRASESEVLARLHPMQGNPTQWQRGHYLHPGILDSAFQATVGLLLARMPDTELPTMVPVGIESISVYKLIQEGPYYSHVTLDSGSNVDGSSDSLTCNIGLYDVDGSPCASISKLQLKRMPIALKPKIEHTQALVADEPAQQANPAEFFHDVWKEQPTAPAAIAGESVRWLLLGSRDLVEQQLAPAMAHYGMDLTVVPYALHRYADALTLKAILEQADSINGIVFFGDYDTPEENGEASDIGTMRTLFHLFKAVSAHSRKHKDFQRIRFIRATRHAYRRDGDDSHLDLRKSVSTGFLRTARIEFPLMDVRQIDFGNMDDAQLASSLYQELASPGSAQADSPEALYHNGKRHSLVVEPVILKRQLDRNTVFNRDKTYWIVGGTGGVGQVLARYLATHFQCNLVLSSSRRLPEPQQYDPYLAENTDAVASTISFIRELEALGSKVTYISTDVRSPDSLRLSMDAIRKVHSKLDGIYFLALQLDDKMIVQKEWPEYRNMIDMRINGVQELIRQTKPFNPDFFVLFSSLAGLVGNMGQSDYSASNVYMDTLPFAQGDGSCRFISVQWGPWELGQQVSEMVLESLRRSGFSHISPQLGMEALEKIILSDQKNVAFVPGSENAQHIARSINALRQGASPKPRSSTTIRTQQPEDHVMSEANPKSLPEFGTGELQLLMGEFEKQREMLMTLCTNQNTLLVSILGSNVALPHTMEIRPYPEATAPTLMAEPLHAAHAEPKTAPVQQILQPVLRPAAPLADVASSPKQDQPSVVGEPVQSPATSDSLFEFVRSLMAKAVEVPDADIDPDQNFMELGVYSLSAMSMVKDIEQRYNIELPPTALFEYTTLNELVDFLKTEIRMS